MSEQRTVRVFISSPSDVRPERLRAEQIIARLDREFAYRFRVEAVLWEREPLVASRHFQDPENIPRAGSMDIVVMILWSRLGVPLPGEQYRGALSGREVTGTEWEFEDALAVARQRGVPDLLLYRKTARISADLDDDDDLEERRSQRALVQDFIGRWFRAEDGKGFTAASHSFATAAEFEEQLYVHLRELLARRAGAQTENVAIHWHQPPFRGLLSFEYEHAPVFFGRTRARNELRELVVRQEAQGCAFILVLGASGSGKSSLVKAGLVPDLMLPGMIGRVALVRWGLFRPSERPADLVGALAAALVGDSALPGLVELGYPEPELAALLREAPGRATPPIRQGLAQASRAAQPPLVEHAEARVAIVIDQLEELFTLDGIDDADRDAFVAALDALARSGLVWVVATMRSDFYDRLELAPSLARLANDQACYRLLPPDDAELGQIIRQPAQEAGLRFEFDPRAGVSLDAVILQAAAKDRGALPLLSFLLDQLWQRRTVQGELTFAAYNELGGLEGALGRRAEEVFIAQQDAAQSALPRLLRALVTVGQGAHAATIAARPAPLAAFPEGSAERRLTEAFLAPEARLFVADESDAGQARIRLTHEALLTHWPRASQHIAQDRNDLRTRAAVEAAEVEWRASGTQAGYLLHDPLLTNAVDLDRRWGGELATELRGFIGRSAAAERAVARRRWTIAAVVMLLLAGLAVASIGALVVAERQSDEVLIAQSHFLAGDSHAATARGDAVLGELLALSGLPHGGRRPFVLAAEGALEDGAANRFERLDLVGHDSNVWSASFSPDGKEVVTASADHTARIWDAATGATLMTLRGHDNQVNSASFSPDGKRLVTASDDKTVRLWDAATGTLLTVLSGHEGRVNSAVFSPDGKRIASASDDKTARLWDAGSGALIATLRGHDDAVNSMAFSPDGKRLVTASDDKTARLWDAQTGAPSGTILRGHDGGINDAEFSPDGKRVVTASADHTARLWDAGTGAALGILRGNDGPVSSAAFSPDGQSIVTGSGDGSVRLWDAGTEIAFAILRGHEGEVNFATFSPDGKTVSSASADGTARLWDIKNSVLLEILRGHTDGVKSVAFSPDGKRLATASTDKTARLWNADTGAVLMVLQGHEGTVYAASFSPDGKRVVTASADKTARVWDADSGKLLTTLQGHTDNVVSAMFSPDGKRVLTASDDKTARLWDAETGAVIAVLQGHDDEVYSAMFSPDGKRVVTASADKTARLWDAGTGAPLGILRGHTDGVNDAEFSPDGKQVVTASDDKTARLWNVATRTTLVTLRVGAGVASAAFSPDGKQVVTASVDMTAQLWDAASGTPLAAFRGHQGSLRYAAFSPDGKRLATASDDKTARIWQLPPRCQSLIDSAIAEAPVGVPRELSDAQRRQYFLQDQPAGLLMHFYAAIEPAIAWMVPAASDKCE